MKQIELLAGIIVLTVFIGLQVPSARAQMEFQYQRGSLLNPFSGEHHPTNILTFQHAGSWKLGRSFFFIDFMDDAMNDGFNDKEFYGEWYPSLSFSKLFGQDLKIGPIADISAVGGLNFDGDANVLKILPGIQLSWNIPGFIFVNTDFAVITDHSDARQHDPGFMFDVSWLRVFKIGSQSFSFMGHAEYISEAARKDGGGVYEAWILAQPQLVWDIGNAFKSPDWLHVGIELQYWSNKLGVEGQDEFRPELLIIWRMQ